MFINNIMQLVVNPVVGRPFILNNVEFSNTIKQIKNKIQNTKQIPVNRQILICRNQLLNNGNKRLEHYPNISNDRQIRLRIIPEITNSPRPVPSPSPSGGKKGGTKNKGRKIYKGPRGGKYYMRGGNKVYI